MFLHNNICLFCKVKKTKVREHWCKYLLEYIVLCSITNFGTNANTGALTQFLVQNANSVKMSRSRACSAIADMNNDDIITIRADVVDPRRNTVWLKNPSYAVSLQELVKKNMISLKLNKTTKHKLMKEFREINDLIMIHFKEQFSEKIANKTVKISPLSSKLA